MVVPEARVKAEGPRIIGAWDIERGSGVLDETYVARGALRAHLES